MPSGYTIVLFYPIERPELFALGRLGELSIRRRRLVYMDTSPVERLRGVVPSGTANGARPRWPFPRLYFPRRWANGFVGERDRQSWVVPITW